MNKILNQIHKLCSPAQLYFIISVLSFLGMLMQNCNDKSSYQIGTFKAPSPCHPMYFFLAKALYILIWTYGLNYLCQKGFKTVSWALVMLPLLGMFIIIGLLLFALLKTEGFEDFTEGNSIDDEDDTTGGFSNETVEESFERPENPSGAPTIESFVEGNEQNCEDGKVWDEGANMCVPDNSGTGGFANRIQNLMEGFREGTGANPCPEGQTFNQESGECESFTNREGFKEGNKIIINIPCPKGQTYNQTNGQCESFSNIEGMQNCDQGMEWDDNTQQCVSSNMSNPEAFELGGDAWPQVGSLM